MSKAILKLIIFLIMCTMGTTSLIIGLSKSFTNNDNKKK